MPPPKPVPPPKQDPPPKQERERGWPSPEKPLCRLFGREWYGEDFLLILLIFVLKEEKADPSLLTALVYLLMVN